MSSDEIEYVSWIVRKGKYYVLLSIKFPGSEKVDIQWTEDRERAARYTQWDVAAELAVGAGGAMEEG